MNHQSMTLLFVALTNISIIFCLYHIYGVVFQDRYGRLEILSIILFLPERGWSSCSTAFVLRLVSDNATANGSAVRSFALPNKPPNAIVLHKICDQQLGLTMVNADNWSQCHYHILYIIWISTV